MRQGALWLALLAVSSALSLPGCASRRRAAGPQPRQAMLAVASAPACEDCAAPIADLARSADPRRAPPRLCLACGARQAEVRTLTVLLCPRCGREVGRRESRATLRRGDLTPTEWARTTHVSYQTADTLCSRCADLARRERQVGLERSLSEMHTYQGSPWAVAISDVTRRAACGPRAAQPGREFVLVYLRVKNVGAESIFISPQHVFVVTANEECYRPDPAGDALPDAFKPGDLEPGASAGGWVAFHTWRADPPIRLVYHNAYRRWVTWRSRRDGVIKPIVVQEPFDAPLAPGPAPRE